MFIIYKFLSISILSPSKILVYIVIEPTWWNTCSQVSPAAAPQINSSSWSTMCLGVCTGVLFSSLLSCLFPLIWNNLWRLCENRCCFASWDVLDVFEVERVLEFQCIHFDKEGVCWFSIAVPPPTFLLAELADVSRSRPLSWMLPNLRTKGKALPSRNNYNHLKAAALNTQPALPGSQADPRKLCSSKVGSPRLASQI